MFDPCVGLVYGVRLLEFAPRRALLKAFLSRMTLTSGCSMGIDDAMMIVEPSTLVQNDD
jgi:hypothetical protein